VTPIPAIKVLPVGSVGLRARLAIDSEAKLSVRCDQVAPASVVIQIPPLVAPMNMVPAPSIGSSKIACTAPELVPSAPSLASPLPVVSSGPKAGDGPCGMNS
jgi:hypothetical protein